MAHSGGEIAAKRANSPGEDGLSALPDDALVRILRHLDTAAAVRTSVLCSRWRRVWTLLPELRFDFAPDPHPVASALAAHEAALRFLHVGALDAAPESVAAWLPVAASRLSGCLVFRNRAPERSVNDTDDKRGAFELPCFERAATISLDLGFLRLAVPAAGVFARLTDLSLFQVRIHGPCKLGDSVSSPRCPCLQKLRVIRAEGLDDITIRSESLQLLDLQGVVDLQHLAVVAPALKELIVMHCFFNNGSQPIANISAPQLVSLEWRDTYDPSSVHLCHMEHIQSLFTTIFPYGIDDVTDNGASLKLLPHYKALNCLCLMIYYLRDIRSVQYLMEDVTILPQSTLLHLMVFNKTHAFGASLFHLLKLCTGVRRLQLELSTTGNFEEQDGCPSDCTCDELENWKTEELTLHCLQEIAIFDMKGIDHEVAFVKRLFSWAAVPTEITFNCSIDKSKAMELRQTLSTFCKPETSLECYMFRDAGKEMWDLVAP